jgi:predicted HAD superfamily Cof-like phosphohydrolase
MTKLTRQVLEFHRQFDHPIADSPTIPSDDRVRFRARFIFEELRETIQAMFDGESPVGDGLARDKWHVAAAAMKDIIDHAEVKVDLAEVVDGLADLDYVVEGTRLEFGINGEPIADEVHRANMTKWHDGKVVKREDGKTLKPPGWTPPDIAGELEKQRRGKNTLGSKLARQAAEYNALRAMARDLPAMTEEQLAEQRLDFAYGNLAIDGKASRSAFKILATTTVDGGLGWSEERFDAWAADRKWDAP